MLMYVSLAVLAGVVAAHEMYPGKCPDFSPMQGFDWERFSDGRWYVTRKFSTKSSCLTYEFKTDNLGFKSIEQIRQLPFKDAIGVDHEYKYTGKLFVPQESQPAKMVVRFPLNAIGSASYVVSDTDYDSYGIVCTCQDLDLFITYAHRISCSILQRKPEEDPEITGKMEDKVPEKYAHDFDKIDQSECEYDKEKAWEIDVDKIIGQVSGVDDQDDTDYYAYSDVELINPDELKEIASDISSSFEGSQDTIDDLKEKATDIV